MIYQLSSNISGKNGAFNVNMFELLKNRDSLSARR